MKRGWTTDTLHGRSYKSTADHYIGIADRGRDTPLRALITDKGRLICCT